MSCYKAVRQVSTPDMGDWFLVQQQFGGLNTPLRVKPLLYDVVIEKIGEREQTHPLVVGHPTTNNLMAFLP